MIKIIYRRIKRIFSTIPYLGLRFKCPVCGWRFNKLKECGIIPRSNAQCPWCGSVERHRLLWLYFKEKTNLFTDKLKLLHFAPEKHFYRVFSRNRNIDYLPADISSPRAKVHMDIQKITASDNSFDVVLCNHVLEHVPDDLAAMRELYRVLKKGGWAIIQSPVDETRAFTYEDSSIINPEEREKAFGHKEHVRIYGRDYKNRLEDSGFTVNTINYCQDLGEKLSHKYCLLTDELIYFCTK